MGNTPPTTATSFRRTQSNGYYSYEVRVGSAAVDVAGKIKEKSNGEFTESWRMSYDIGWTDCSFDLTKKGNTKSPHQHDEKLDMKIEDGITELTCSSVTVERAKARNVGLLFRHDFDRGFGVTYFPMPITSTANGQGGITETIFDYYWRKKGKWRVLMVYELKKKSKDEEPYMVTMSHYLACIGIGEDVGLSVAVKRIRVSDDGHLDFAVDGPHQHPATSLFYMFDEVCRTRTWPTSCPHCVNYSVAQIQRQPSMSSQSESEDSDKDKKVPTTLLHCRRQNAAGILANDGMVKGNNNGNLIINFSAQKADTWSTEYGLSKMLERWVGPVSRFYPKS